MNPATETTARKQRHNQALELDRTDSLRLFRSKFHIPLQQSGREHVYLVGNSLGLQPRTTESCVQEVLQNWKTIAVRGHFEGDFPWMPYHEFLAEPMAQIVGASSNEVVVMNSLTTNLHLLMASFYRPTPDRHQILIEAHAFPSDHYAVESQIRWHGYDPDQSLLLWQPRPGEELLRIEDFQRLVETQKQRLAMILLPGVQYYTGQALNIGEITRIAREHGVVIGWDMAHAVGNLELHLHDCGADFAVWCCYKYLNSGPGAVGGCFVHQRHATSSDIPRLAGWWGHDQQTRFEMKNEFRPTPSADGWQLSNPPILSLAAIRASLGVFREAGFMAPIREKSIRMAKFMFESLIAELGDRIEIITPDLESDRGCQISFKIRGKLGKSISQRLDALGFVTDYREPDVIRAAPTPLYNSFQDICEFVNALGDLSRDKSCAN